MADDLPAEQRQRAAHQHRRRAHHERQRADLCQYHGGIAADGTAETSEDRIGRSEGEHARDAEHSDAQLEPRIHAQRARLANGHLAEECTANRETAEENSEDDSKRPGR
jgi:hypothetical protein